MRLQMVILFGSARSGTSWIHLLLGAHPEIVTGQQARVFSRYLLPIYDGWTKEVQTVADDHKRIHGISSYVSEENLVLLIRQFAEGIFSPLESEKPGARLVVENQPGDVMSLPLIAKCFPDVKFIHSIRDGRDTVVSLVHGYRGFQIPSVSRAARWWRERIEIGRQAKDLGAGYIEIRYEDLKNNGVSELLRLYDFLGVDRTEEQALAVYNEYRFENVRAGKHKSPFVNPGPVIASGTGKRREPKGFFRSGTSGQWRDFFSRGDLRAFNRTAGGTPKEFGYDLCEPSELPFFRLSVVPLPARVKNILCFPKRLLLRSITRSQSS